MRNDHILRLVETYNANVGKTFPMFSIFDNRPVQTFRRLDNELLRAAIGIVRCGMPDFDDVPARILAQRALKAFRYFGCVDVFPKQRRSIADRLDDDFLSQFE